SHQAVLVPTPYFSLSHSRHAFSSSGPSLRMCVIHSSMVRPVFSLRWAIQSCTIWTPGWTLYRDLDLGAFALVAFLATVGLPLFGLILGQAFKRLAQAALALEEAPRPAAQECHDLKQFLDAPHAFLRRRGNGAGVQLVPAPPQRPQDRVDLAAPALAGDQGELDPDVAERLVVFP